MHDAHDVVQGRDTDTFGGGTGCSREIASLGGWLPAHGAVAKAPGPGSRLEELPPSSDGVAAAGEGEAGDAVPSATSVPGAGRFLGVKYVTFMATGSAWGEDPERREDPQLVAGVVCGEWQNTPLTSGPVSFGHGSCGSCVQPSTIAQSHTAVGVA